MIEDQIISDHNLIKVDIGNETEIINRTKIFRRNWTVYHPADLVEIFEELLLDFHTIKDKAVYVYKFLKGPVLARLMKVMTWLPSKTRRTT